MRELKRLDEALASFDRALALKPDHGYAFSGIVDCVNKLCDWRRTTDVADEVVARISEQKSIFSPFVLLGYSDDPLLQLQCARNRIADSFPSPPIWTGVTWCHDKVRIAYLSADFHRHATAYLMAELFERHDRCAIRDHRRVIRRGRQERDALSGWSRHSTSFMTSAARATTKSRRLLRELEIDIAVDLKGFTHGRGPAFLRIVRRRSR